MGRTSTRQRPDRRRHVSSPANPVALQVVAGWQLEHPEGDQRGPPLQLRELKVRRLLLQSKAPADRYQQQKGALEANRSPVSSAAPPPCRSDRIGLAGREGTPRPIRLYACSSEVPTLPPRRPAPRPRAVLRAIHRIRQREHR